MVFESRTYLSAWVPVVAVLFACGSFKDQPKGPTKAEVYAAVLASTAPDDDGDGLPNDVERRYRSVLGTDPELRDSDGDGIDDGFEVFGASWLYLHSRGRSGTLAPAEQAQGAADPGRDHTADLVDSDGDGVPDYLEFAGYTYDWREARFVLDPAGFHTDPLQWSTDQDAYGDGMEVSGLNMDVAVRAPGNHPLVPAYPDIVVELTGYEIALNEQVTDGSGGVLEKGLTWTREVGNEHSSGSEVGFTAGAEFNFGTGGGLTLKAEASAKWTTTDTHSETVSSGGSFTEQVNWNKARSYNPAEAARMKLFVRVHNRGTAPASNLVPTISVRIAGANVSTFEAPVPIYMLLPGGAYPPDPGTSLVLERDASGNPLTLTDWELRALQSRGPITLAVTQKKADVMRLTRDGAWERVGDVNEYLARIVSVSAGVFLDVGVLPDGGTQARLARRLVYAGQGETAPHVTLSDALRWTDDFVGNAVTGYTLSYRNDDGSTTTVPLAGAAQNDGIWRCEVDPATIEANWPNGTRPTSADQVLGLALLPGSQVSLRAPRPQQAELPIIHNAYAVPNEDGYEIVACATDYDAVARVVFVDKIGREIEMRRDGRGPWFFSASLPGYVFSDAQGLSSVDVVRVESQRTDAQGARLAATRAPEVEYTPKAQAPILRRTTYDNDTHRFYARVEPGGPLSEDDVDWVRLYHPDLVQEAVRGYRALSPTIFAFEDPYGWEVTLTSYLPGMRLVGHTRGGKYVSANVDELQDLSAYQSGSVWLRAGSDWNMWPNDNEFWTPEVDLDSASPGNLDCGDAGLRAVMVAPGLYQWSVSSTWSACVANDPRQETHYVAWDDFLSNNPAQAIWDWWFTLPDRGGRPDLYVRTTAADTSSFVVGFHVAGTIVTDFGGLTAQQYYQSRLGYAGVLNLSSTFLPGLQGNGSAESYRVLQEGTVLAFVTDDGRLGKAYVRTVFGLDEFAFAGDWSYQANARIDYVVYPKGGDFHAPGGLAYPTPDAVYAVGQAIAPNTPTITTGDLPQAYRLCAAPARTPCLTEDPALLPAGLVFDARTGVISGTPLASMRRSERSIAATNGGGETWTSVWITVLDPPSGLDYGLSSVSFDTGYAATVLTPTVSGDVDWFDVSPALPAGLVFAHATGRISGTPTVVTAPADYLVSASNRAGSTTTAILRVATPLGAPSRIVYGGSPYTLTVGTPAPSLVPTRLGGPAVWTVDPPLPTGLALDPDTGALYGTPTAAAAGADYTARAENVSGFATAVFHLTVN